MVQRGPSGRIVLVGPNVSPADRSAAPTLVPPAVGRSAVASTARSASDVSAGEVAPANSAAGRDQPPRGGRALQATAPRRRKSATISPLGSTDSRTSRAPPAPGGPLTAGIRPRLQRATRTRAPGPAATASAAVAPRDTNCGGPPATAITRGAVHGPPT